MISLYEFMKEYGPEKTDSITDKDSVVKHFRTTSKVYKSERDSLITDVADLRNQRDKLQHKLDSVVELFKTHLAYKKAWSDNPYYDKLQNELNKLLEGE
ncbi:hypothetical protein PQ701_04280 [Staphylococcus coagulans]|uniref:hypothetical protein n=1 Tax=Staphylococcus coagulans TaxID=74706 RepID=UPI00292A110C|nr:hypothetical protein [Staphylococcus coagulans]MDU9304439.1 hypothetical protein [Staphylococcus coagulans]